MKLNQLNIPTALPFILAGKCTLTIKSLQSGNHFTYKVRETNEKNDFFFVSVLSGTEDQYRYLGYVRNGVYVHGGHKAKVGVNTPLHLAFNLIFNLAKVGKNNINAELYHAGKCGKCGRKLTHPESLQTGIGPDCATRM